MFFCFLNISFLERHTDSDTLTKKLEHVWYLIKAMRKFNVFNDIIYHKYEPTQSSIYGFFCSQFMYVQLMKDHLKIWKKKRLRLSPLKVTWRPPLLDKLTSFGQRGTTPVIHSYKRESKNSWPGLWLPCLLRRLTWVTAETMGLSTHSAVYKPVPRATFSTDNVDMLKL